MKNVILSIGLVVCFSTLLIAQEQQQPQTPPPSNPAPAPPPSNPGPTGPPGTPVITRNGRLGDLARPLIPSQSDLNAEINPTEIRVLMIQKYAQPLYRKPTAKELQKISPEPSLYSQYSEFLKRENTGVFRFAPNRNCDTDTKVLVASEECLLYTMPGSGNSYSFRTGSYRFQRLLDLTFADGMFQTLGVLAHGIITDLGKLPIESISLN